MVRRGWMATGAVVAAVLLLAGCGSGSNSTGTSTTSTSAVSSAQSSTATSGAVTTVGGDVTEFDTQTTTWFDTMCTGIAPLSELSSSLSTAASTADLSTTMTSVGTAFTDTALKLQDLPAPTFDGGDALAQTVEQGLQNFGQTFVDFGVRAAQLKDGDSAGLQQFQNDLQSELADSPVTQLDATPAVQQQIQKIPSCEPYFGS